MRCSNDRECRLQMSNVRSYCCGQTARVRRPSAQQGAFCARAPADQAAKARYLRSVQAFRPRRYRGARSRAQGLWHEWRVWGGVSGWFQSWVMRLKTLSATIKLIIQEYTTGGCTRKTFFLLGRSATLVVCQSNISQGYLSGS